jgi:hypothetical protein
MQAQWRLDGGDGKENNLGVNNDSIRSDIVMMLAGLAMIAIAGVTMLTAEGALPAPLVTIGLVFTAIGARRRRQHR